MSAPMAVCVVTPLPDMTLPGDPEYRSKAKTVYLYHSERSLFYSSFAYLLSLLLAIQITISSISVHDEPVLLPLKMLIVLATSGIQVYCFSNREMSS